MKLLLGTLLFRQSALRTSWPIGVCLPCLLLAALCEPKAEPLRSISRDRQEAAFWGNWAANKAAQSAPTQPLENAKDHLAALRRRRGLDLSLEEA